MTLIAFGSACPELLLNIVSAQENESALSQPAILGSAMIAFGFIPPLCCFFSKARRVLRLKTRPLIRDCFVYMVALVGFLYVSQDGSTSPWEMMGMVSIYVVYVVTVVLDSDGELSGSSTSQDDVNRANLEDDIEGQSASLLPMDSKKKKTTRTEAGTPSDLNLQLQSDGPSPRNTDKNCDVETEVAGDSCTNGDISDTGSGRKSNNYWGVTSIVAYHIIGFLDKTCSLILSYTIPPLLAGKGHSSSNNLTGDVEALTQSPPSSPGTTDGNLGFNRVNIWRAGLVLGFAIVHITCLVSLLIETCVLFLEALPGVSTTTIGGTVVAMGSQLPDIMSSVALARGGYSDAAMAGAVGSQVINLTLGVALPALSLLLTGGRAKINVDDISSLGLLTSLVLFVQCAYLVCAVPFMQIVMNRGTIPEYAHLNRGWSWVLLGVFTVSYGLFIGINETY